MIIFRPQNRVAWSFRSLFISLSLLTFFFARPAHAQIKSEIFKDGVVHSYIQESARGDSYLSRKFSQIYNVVLNSLSVRPFGKSIAFLVGVSKYDYLSPLPSVRNDVSDMRDFLLNKAGFDEVYVATDSVVNRDLVERYVKGILPAKMSTADRLLFYYSGHGGDNKGRTGYMLFGGAKNGQFYGQDVLAVDSLNDWSRELPIQHVLFILDSCSSGFGIVEKSGASDSDALLLRTLSGNGSRTVLTAGTADEETYAEENRNQTGNSIFTKTLLKAFDSRSLSDSSGLITINDLFGDVEKEMARFRALSGKSTTPRVWSLQPLDYRGTFVFLNLRAISAQLTREQAKALQIDPKAKSGDATVSGFGTIQVYSVSRGTLYIDGKEMGYILPGQTRDFEQQIAGSHNLEIRVGTETEEKKATLSTGGIVDVSFGLKSPIDESGDAPVGTLVVSSTHGLSGEVFLDSFSVGRLEENGALTIHNVTVGHHAYQVVGVAEIEESPVEIRQNETVYSIPAPSPPTLINITVQ